MAMRALAGSLTWLQAADILNIHPRSLRRWRARYEQEPRLGLLDRRPSHLTAPRAEVQRILRLYREHYQGFNVRHFHQLTRRDHAVTLSYTFVKLALQAAGLVGKRRARGRHRQRRAPRACYGELLHLDGSPHAWLVLQPAERQTLIAVLDDATKRLLYAQLWPAETLQAVMQALAHGVRCFVIRRRGPAMPRSRASRRSCSPSRSPRSATSTFSPSATPGRARASS
jgi:hypothetical protein